MGYLSLIPAKVWCLLGAAALCLAGAWWHAHESAAAIQEAVDADRAQWQESARDELEQATIEVHKQQTTAALAMLEITHEDANRANVAQVDADRTRALNDGLQHTIAALRRGSGTESQSLGAISLTDAAPALAAALGQCSSEYGEVAAVADKLSNKVTALQSYITDVVGPIAIEKIPTDSTASGGI